MNAPVLDPPRDLPQGESPFSPTVDDLCLERGIQAAYDATLKAGTHDAQRAAFRLLSELVAQRSEGMVRFMESQRGIG